MFLSAGFSDLPAINATVFSGCFPKFANMLHSMQRQDLNKKSEIREIIFNFKNIIL